MRKASVKKSNNQSESVSALGCRKKSREKCLLLILSDNWQETYGENMPQHPRKGKHINPREKIPQNHLLYKDR